MGTNAQTQENARPEQFLIWIKDRATFARSMFGGWSNLASLVPTA
jgi:hypothetical protein